MTDVILTTAIAVFEATDWFMFVVVFTAGPLHGLVPLGKDAFTDATHDS